MNLSRLAIVAAILAGLSAQAEAQVNTLPRELGGVGIDEKQGATLPRDVELTDQDGHAVRFGDYLDGQKPVVLVFAYFRCPMLCSMVLNALGRGLHELAWDAGSRFRVVTVSIDPTDTPQMAKAKREHQLGAYGRDPGPRGWDFLVGPEVGVRRLADTVGFHYRYDADQKQYAHAAGVFLLTPDGRLSRTLYGITYSEKDLRLGLVEASQGRLGGTVEKLLLFCYHYDPQAKGYVVAAERLMRAGGLLSVVLLGLFLVRLFRSPEEGAHHRQPSVPSEEAV